jgi:hypothetical protein
MAPEGGSMSSRILISVLLLAASPAGQGTMDTSRAKTTHYPSLIHAEMPLYPLVARATHTSGTIEIQVTVENGLVVDAQVKSTDMRVTHPSHRAVYGAEAKSHAAPLLTNPSIENVKTWQFQPNGRDTFTVTYIYVLESDKKPLPQNENPKIELDLPRLVKITARPFKPECDDCAPQK